MVKKRRTEERQVVDVTEVSVRKVTSNRVRNEGLSSQVEPFVAESRSARAPSVRNCGKFKRILKQG